MTSRHLDSGLSPSASPPVNYSSSADIRLQPYEGERSVAAILHMDELVPRVLSFLTAVELLFVPSVCRSWRAHAVTARGTLVKRLHMGQFWSRIGVLPDAVFIKLASGYTRVTELNLSYCSFLTGSSLNALLHALPAMPQLSKLNLFYCFQLTDDDMQTVMGGSPPPLPALRELNLGRCSKLTERTIRLLAEHLPSLQLLSLAHMNCVGEETPMLFDDLRNFPSLSLLNVLHCSKWQAEHVDELVRGAAVPGGRNAQLAKLGRPPFKVIGPQETFQVDKSGKRMRKDLDADT